MPSTPLASARRWMPASIASSSRIGRDDQLAAVAVRHALFCAIGVQRASPGDAEARHEAVRRIVDAGVNDLAVARGCFGADALGRVQHDDLASGQRQRACHRQADDAGADHDAVDFVHAYAPSRQVMLAQQPSSRGSIATKQSRSRGHARPVPVERDCQQEPRSPPPLEGGGWGRGRSATLASTLPPAPTRKGRGSWAPCGAPFRVNPVDVLSVDDDLHPPVLRLAHAGAGRHQQMRLAVALDLDSALRHAVADQLAFHRLRAAHRQPLVVLRRA